nr:penicillin-binding protein 2 [Lactobacillus selangorensis]
MDSKEKPQKPNRAKSNIPFRLNLLFFIVFLLFAALVGQLAYLQIMYGSKFSSSVNSTDQTTVSGAVPRGMMYDTKGRVLVGNKAQSAITYTKGADTLSTQMYAVANKLGTYITVDTDTLTPQDKADYYLADAHNLKTTNAKLPKSQKVDSSGSELAEKTVYKNQIAYVEAHHLDELTATQKNAAAIYKIMNGAYQMSTVYIKNSGLTSATLAKVSEHLTELPGVSVGTDWERSYPNGEGITSIIGNVSTEKQGLPSDQLTELLSDGYSRNDRVGTSYLEKEYQSILSGTKSQTEVKTNSEGSVKSTKEVYAGKKGASLNLTIDSKYQNQVEAALKKEFKAAVSDGAAKYSDGAYAMAMDPNTGAVLAIAGVKQNRKTGKITDNALGAINQTFVPGSAVKGATVMGALMDGVITPTNNTQSDDAIYLPGTAVKKSVYPVGTFTSLDAVTALEISSNIYMMRLAMKEGNAKYVADSSFSIDHNIFATERGYFNQFGLGVKTGIDLPGEASPYIGSTTNSDGSFKSGSALDLSYGNYDAYTVVELAQYVSTIANNGRRMQPYVVKSVESTSNNGKKGQVESVTMPKVMNTVNATKDEFNVVHKGFYETIHGTNAWATATRLKSLSPSAAAKTGTAQTFAHTDPDNDNSKQVETMNLSLVAYAPYKNPKVAIALIFPNMTDEDGAYNTVLGKEMISDYYKDYNIK